MRHTFAVIVAAGLIGILPESLAAQTTPTAVVGIQGLTFGPLTAGLAEPVRLNDAWRRGEVRLEGERALDLTMILPTSMVAASGASIPLRFVNGDASFTIVSSNQTTVFDPNVGAKVGLRKNSTAALLYIGGTALPTAQQAAGRYTATLVIVLAKPGT